MSDTVKSTAHKYLKKGTTSSVQEKVTAILPSGQVQEWFDYDGKPYCFRLIESEGQILEADVYLKINKAIQQTKNARSWFDGIALYRTINSNIFLGIALGAHKKISISPATFTMPDIAGEQYVGIAQGIHKKIGISPAPFAMPEIMSKQYFGGVISVHKKEVIYCV